MPDAAPGRGGRKNGSRPVSQEASILGSVQRTEIDPSLFRGNVRVQEMAAVGQKCRVTKCTASVGNINRSAAGRQDSLDTSARRAGFREEDDVLVIPRSAARAR